MSQTTEIAYCDSTTNPMVGCSGCELYSPNPTQNHCYAATLVGRYAGLNGWPASFTQPELFPYRIERALAWSDLTGQSRPSKPWLNGLPRIIFLNDLGDTFSPSAPNPVGWLLPHLDDMSRKHIWLILTKWPRRMREFFERAGGIPPNFWLGTSVTSQATVHRVDELIKIPGASVGLKSIRMDAGDGFQFIRIGKQLSGDVLNGSTWHQLPSPYQGEG